MRDLVLYRREGCSPCAEAARGLAVIAAEFDGVAIRLVDVDDDPELARRLGPLVPVIELDGVLVCEFWLDEGAVRARLGSLSM